MTLAGRIAAEARVPQPAPSNPQTPPAWSLAVAHAGAAAGPEGLATLVAAPPTPPPPPSIPGGPWTWLADPSNSRGGTFRGQDGSSASWDAKDGHWDVDNGRGERSRYNRFGASLTPDEAHGRYNGPPRFPLPFRELFRMLPPLLILPEQERVILGRPGEA